MFEVWRQNHRPSATQILPPKFKPEKEMIKVCIILLVHIFLKKIFVDFLTSTYAVARTEHDALVKSSTKIFSNFVAFSENPNFKTRTHGISS